MHIAAFLPAYQITSILIYMVVACLLYTYFRQTKTLSLLYLLGGCVYTSAILCAQFLSFYAAFVPNARLLGGTQTGIWLWFFWHLGLTGMFFLYALSEWRAPQRTVGATQRAVRTTAVVTAAATVGSILAVTVFHDLLPIADVGGDFSRITATGYAPGIQVVIVLAILMLWRGTGLQTPLAAWLGVAMVALLFDNTITMAGGTRLSAGWYVGRINALLSAVVMLAIYLKEINGVYLRAAANAGELAVAHGRLEAEHLRLLTLFEQAPGLMAVLSAPQYRVDMANAAFMQLTGQRSVIGRPACEAVPELAAQGLIGLLDAVCRTRQPCVAHAVKLTVQGDSQRPDKECYDDVVLQPELDANGTVRRIFMQGHDVTEQKLAHDRLTAHQATLTQTLAQRTKTLEHARAALLHAQTFETVGKLTGGVAHDLNNVLHAINGNIDLIGLVSRGNATIESRCLAAHTAVERGAKLASQLVSFARQQSLPPAAIDLHAALAEIDVLLKRIVGSRIALAVDLAESLWQPMADLQQLNTVIMHLVRNGAEAIHGQGKVTVRACNTLFDAEQASVLGDVAQGAYVALSVTDTGCGMPREIRARAGDPFVTTKEAGQGAGLGLHTADAFARQSGGHLQVDSTPGCGTTVTVFLPRAPTAAASVTTAGRTA